MILLAAHDAGGAEVVSSWALRQEGDLRYEASGPAVGVFRRKLGGRVDRPGDVTRFERVVCGTGLGTVERSLILRAREAGVYCVAYLDHWKYYAARFDVLPDEVWVTDRWAKNLAERELPGARVLIKGNPYLEDTLAEVRRLGRRPSGGTENVLYVAEPRREREFQRWLQRTARKRMNLWERPHPSVAEPVSTLAEDLAWADTVVGFDSMALAVAVRAGRRTVSILSPSERLTIPFPGIERETPYRPRPHARIARPSERS